MNITMNNSIFNEFYKIGILPVLEIEKADRAIPVTESLIVGGLPVVEITLRTDAALDAIGRVARNIKDVIVGAGTVLNREQAKAACEAGAQFLVSPGMVDEVVVWAQEQHIPILAGAITPSEIIRGINLGLNILKFFPAETIGGLKAIQAMSDPFPRLRFIPTGGINLENAGQYLRSPKIHAVGGSWMAKRSMIAELRFNEITRLAKEASDLVKQVRRNEL